MPKIMDANVMTIVTITLTAGSRAATWATPSTTWTTMFARKLSPKVAMYSPRQMPY